MVAGRIDLIFRAIDQASGTTKRIGDEVDKLGKSTQFGVGEALKLGTAFGLAMKTVDLVANAASSAVGFLGDRISEASNAQNDIINTTGILQGLLKVPYLEAGKVVSSLNEEIFKHTNALPGLTQDYSDLANSIIDNVIPAAKGMDGALNTKKLIDYTVELSKVYGLLGKGAGLQRSDVTLGLTRAMGGGSMAELRNLGLFERNPALLNQIKEELTRRGVAELKDVDEKTRIDILRKVGNSLISPETLNALQGTFSGKIENLMGTLFDPQNGIFGFLKKVGNRGGRTVLDSISGAFDNVTKFFDIVGKIGEKLGFTSTSGLELLIDFFDGVNRVAGNILDSINVDAVAGFLSGLGNIFNAIGNAASQVMNGDLMKAIDIGMMAQQLGEAWGTAIGDWIVSIDWATALIELGRILIVIGTFVANFVAGFSSALLDALGKGVDVLTTNIAAGIVGTIQTFCDGIVSGFSSAMSSVSSSISSVWSDLTANLANAAKNLIPGLGNSSNSGTSGSVNLGAGTLSYSRSSYSMGGDNFYVNVSGAGNSEQVAYSIVDALDAKWKQYKGTRFNNAGMQT